MREIDKIYIENFGCTKDEYYARERAKPKRKKRSTNIEYTDFQLFMQEVFRERAKRAYFDNPAEENRYYRMKWNRYKFNEQIAAQPQKQQEEEYKYNSPGREGFEWLQQFCDLSNLAEAPKMDATRYNIQQFYNKAYAGKVVENVTSFDKIGAYVSWLIKPLPVGELLPYNEDYNSDEFIPLFECPQGEFTFLEGRLTKPVGLYKLEKLKGIDAWFEDYKILLATNKPRAKKLAVSAIGYMKRINILAAYYIWYKQGEDIKQVKLELECLHLKPIKCHTDSIAFRGLNANNEGEIHSLFAARGYKCEYQDKNIYIINAGCYQVEGEKPKGYNNPNGENKVKYVTEDNTFYYKDYSDFPCLELGTRVRVLFAGAETTKQLGEHNEL